MGAEGLEGESLSPCCVLGFEIETSRNGEVLVSLCGTINKTKGRKVK